MAATPKVKRAPTRSAASADRTSTVVTATLIGLTVLGVLTVFWEPLAALAGGGPTTDVASEPRPAAPDAGVVPSTNAPSAPADASGSS